MLDNVTLELDHLEKGKTEAERDSGTCPLACINFIRSRLTFESFSDESKDVDLVSQEILISDTRFEGKLTIEVEENKIRMFEEGVRQKLLCCLLFYSDLNAR